MKRYILLILMLAIAPMIMAPGPNVGRPVTSASGPNVSYSGPIWMYEQAANPTCQPDRGVLFTKEIAGITELFFMNSSPACNVIQVTVGGVTPVGQVDFVGLTTLAYDGNDKGNYVAVTAQCVTDTVDADARPCTDLDIGLLVFLGETFGGLTDEVWVQDGAPGYVSFSNDCEAWSSVAIDHFGAYWNLNTKIPYISGCAMAKKYACCKG